MRYFSQNLVNSHPRQHGAWWDEVQVVRNHFHAVEEGHAAIQNAAAILPRDAWLDLDGITRRVMRADEGSVWMNDLMPLAKPVNIGKLVHLNRVSSDVGDPVIRTMSGQVPVPLDKVTYDFRGTPVPIFAKGYYRNWREWNTLQSENFDALADDQEATTAKVKRNMALYVLDGDATINVGGYPAYGIRTSPLSKAINLGTAAGGAGIDLADPTTTADEIEAFVNGAFGAMLDDNYVTVGVNWYVSPEIARNLDKPYSLAGGFKPGSIRDALLANRRINKIETSFELSGNEFFWFAPNADYIRPLIGMAVATTAMARINPRDNYQFEVAGAMGIEIRADFNGRTAVGYSVVNN